MKLRVLAFLACFCPVPVLAQDVELSLNDARVLATRAASSGEYAVAVELARKLLAVDPDDRTALIVLAVAAPQLGNPDAGWRAGARAWRLSDTDAQKYEAARVTALAANNAEAYTLATIWLRLALLDAPNEAERERTIADARIVDQRNPWSPSVGLSIVPSNNVNGGSSTDEGTLGGVLSEDAQALPGIRTSLNLATSYRLEPSPQTRITFGLRHQPSWVRLEDETLFNGSAFNSALSEANAQILQGAENGFWVFGVATGSFDFGGSPYYDYKRLNLSRALNLNDNTLLQLSGIREFQDYESTNVGVVRRGTLSANLSYTLPSGDRISGGLSYLSSDGRLENFAFQQVSLRGLYQWTDPIGPITLTVTGDIKYADYPAYNEVFAVPGGREDTVLTLGAIIGFPEIEIAGFVPGLSITASKSDSNVTRFQRETVSAGFTLSSSF
ncbi:surface lipoprotein assembly modifier [Yoonia sp. BS5-3]|uniref:Surface lipoprotein assembly modifier n=1 Tax=Yoonia phaeophyticola TaxID=3137369 RepID=A0ABZ2UZ39_9RHOB